MTDLQAAIGIAQLKKLENLIDKKSGRISKYKQLLEGLNVELPIKIPETRDVHWMHPILFESSDVRDKVKENLEKNNIPVGEMFYPCHKQLHLNADKLNLEISELVFNRGIILPDSLEMTDKEIEFVVDKIKEVI
jgi:dTDP-4-amino-4,6-dideoxygalactose transaminase